MPVIISFLAGIGSMSLFTYIFKVTSYTPVLLGGVVMWLTGVYLTTYFKED